MRGEARARGRLDAKHAHQRLSAMVTGADGDARIVQYGGRVVRVHPVDVEADDAGAALGAVEGNAVDAAQRLARFGDERAFVRVDRVEREVLDPVDRGVQPDRADDVRSPRFEARRRRPWEIYTSRRPAICQCRHSYRNRAE